MYRDNLLAIVIAIFYYRLSLSLKIFLIYRLPISLLQYILLSPINYLNKRPSLIEKIHGVYIKSCNNLKILFVLFNTMTESVNCSLFLKILEK